MKNNSFQHRLRELARKEKQMEKTERRAQRRAEKAKARPVETGTKDREKVQ
jgi:hypothetical protein